MTIAATPWDCLLCGLDSTLSASLFSDRCAFTACSTTEALLPVCGMHNFGCFNRVRGIPQRRVSLAESSILKTPAPRMNGVMEDDMIAIADSSPLSR